MYEIFKDFAGPVATIIAAFAALYVTVYFGRHQKRIAEQQASVAREKLRYDLFDRRLEIFSSIFGFYDALISWKGTSEHVAARNRFFKAYQESAFLFATESGVEAILKELNDKGNRVIGFKEEAERLKDDKASYLQMFKEVQNIQVTEFPDGLAQVKSAMSKYMNFHEV